MKRRPKKMLLAATALVCGPLELACHNHEALPSNPKGSVYDDGTVVVPDASAEPPNDETPSRTDASEPAAEATAQGDAAMLVAGDGGETRPKRPYLKSNPKGSHYDKGSTLDPFATKPKADAGKPKPRPLPANPKGSHYDKGSTKPTPPPPPPKDPFGGKK